MTQELEQRINQQLTERLGPISLGVWHQSGMSEWKTFAYNNRAEQWQITVNRLPLLGSAITIVKYVTTLFLN